MKIPNMFTNLLLPIRYSLTPLFHLCSIPAKLIYRVPHKEPSLHISPQKTSILSHFIQFRDCLSWLSIIKFPQHQISYHPRSDTHQAEENTPHNIRSKRTWAKINSNIIVCDTRPEENKRYYLPKPFATVLGTRTII